MDNDAAKKFFSGWKVGVIISFVLGFIYNDPSLAPMVICGVMGGLIAIIFDRNILGVNE